VLIDALSVQSIGKENCNLIAFLFVLDTIDRGGDEFHVSPLHVYLHVAALDNHTLLVLAKEVNVGDVSEIHDDPAVVVGDTRAALAGHGFRDVSKLVVNEILIVSHFSCPR